MVVAIDSPGTLSGHVAQRCDLALTLWLVRLTHGDEILALTEWVAVKSNRPTKVEDASGLV